MKILTFSVRTAKEILRDPLNLGFGLGFPIVLLLLLSAIQANVPVSLFEIKSLTPGITVFGLSFMTLFSATLLAKDRESAFLQRLYTTPLTAADFILGYALPILPAAAAQSAICYITAIPLGLPFSAATVYALLLIIPVSMFFIALGLLCGSVLGVKAIGGVCGALLTNLTAWLSSVWFDLDLVGGAFKRVAYMLPFVHAVEMERAVLNGNYSGIFPHIYWVLGYTAAAAVLAALLFLRQMRQTTILQIPFSSLTAVYRA